MTARDSDLLAACRRGDAGAFQRLFEVHAGRVRAVALGFFAGDRAAADDVVQAVFLKLHDKLGGFREDAALATWLHRLVVNACLDDRRARRRLVPLEAAAAAWRGAEQADAAEAAERARRVREAVAALPPKLRIAVLLRHYEELSYDDMARALGCSAGTVASRLNRGHAALARLLGELAEGKA